jgi:hypothetical protein
MIERVYFPILLQKVQGQGFRQCVVSRNVHPSRPWVGVVWRTGLGLLGFCLAWQCCCSCGQDGPDDGYHENADANTSSMESSGVE